MWVTIAGTVEHHPDSNQIQILSIFFLLNTGIFGKIVAEIQDNKVTDFMGLFWFCGEPNDSGGILGRKLQVKIRLLGFLLSRG